MNRKKDVVVDFVASDNNEWKLVLVEQGPWAGGIDEHLRRFQARLFDAVDAALDGQLAQQFPESAGQHVVVQVDGYNLPKEPVKEFFDRFTKGIFNLDDYKRALEGNAFVKGVRFTINLESIH